MIPRVFHQIWLGPSQLPVEFADYAETWRAHHPSWQHMVWTEGNLPDGLRPEIYQRLRAPAERSDALRYELLARFGGVYVDSDFECLRAIDGLIEGLDFFVADYRGGRVNNAIVGATPNHPLVLEALRQLRPRATWGPVDKHGTGPLLLDRLVRGHDVTVFPRPLFYPEWPERHDAVAYHHMSRSWKDEAGLRRSIEIAEERRVRAERALSRDDSPSVRRAALAQAGLPWRDWLADAPMGMSRRTRRAALVVQRTGVPLLGRVRGRVRVPVRRPLGVPRALHWIRLGDGRADPLEGARADSWRLSHPDWLWCEWTDSTLPEGLRPEIYDRLRSPAERGDLLMLELLLRDGGVAVRAGVSCRRRIEGLVDGHSAFAAGAPGGGATTAFAGAAAGHPAIVHALDVATPVEWFSASDPGTGAAALTRAAAAGVGLEILPSAALFPQTWREWLSAYGTAGSAATHGRTLDELRTRLLDAEARQHEAEDALELARAPGYASATRG